MKIYISNYRYHWISPYTIIENIFFWTDWSKCGRNKGVIEDKDYVDYAKPVATQDNQYDKIIYGHGLSNSYPTFLCSGHLCKSLHASIYQTFA